MHYIISVPLDPKLADIIGKKGSENSITFYNRKLDENVIVSLAPSSIEEKFYAVAQSMLISSEIVVSTADLDKLFGEIIVACSLLNKHVIFTKDNEISKFLSGIKIKDHEFCERQEVLQAIVRHKPAYSDDNEVRVDIDKAFPVKGLGTVILGIVTKGTLKTHDELNHSSGKKVTVRSLQSQDMDVNDAPTGTRVGIAAKGIEPEEIEKGDILSNKPLRRTNMISAKITLSSIAKEELLKGNRYGVVSNFTFSIAVVEEASGDIITLKTEKNVSIMENDEILLIRELASPRIFAHGRVLKS